MHHVNFVSHSHVHASVHSLFGAFLSFFFGILAAQYNWTKLHHCTSASVCARAHGGKWQKGFYAHATMLSGRQNAQYFKRKNKMEIITYWFVIHSCSHRSCNMHYDQQLHIRTFTVINKSFSFTFFCVSFRAYLFAVFLWNWFAGVHFRPFLLINLDAPLAA